jgi:hypothetical protein
LKKRTKKLFPALRDAAGIQAADCVRPTPVACAKHPAKVFWFFFSKKNRFLLLTSMQRAMPRHVARASKAG